MQKLLQISAGVFFMASGAGYRVCASKRRTKRLRGAERKPRRRCSGKKEKFRFRVCASKRGTKGLRGAKRKPRRRCSEGKEKISASGLRIKTENKGIAGSRAQTAPARKKPPPFVSEWGKRRRHIRIIQFWVPRKTGAGANVFLWGIKR